MTVSPGEAPTTARFQPPLEIRSCIMPSGGMSESRLDRRAANGD